MAATCASQVAAGLCRCADTHSLGSYLGGAEPVFLDKAVAAQLRSRRKRHPPRQPRTEDGGGSGTPRGVVISAMPTVQTDVPAGLHRRHGAATAVPENPLRPPKDFNGTSNGWPTLSSSGGGGKSGWDTSGTASREDEEEEEEDESEESSTEEEQQFKNMYMRPWTDIGVELDDESRFVRLEDLDDNDDDDGRSGSDCWSDVTPPTDATQPVVRGDFQDPRLLSGPPH